MQYQTKIVKTQLKPMIVKNIYTIVCILRLIFFYLHSTRIHDWLLNMGDCIKKFGGEQAIHVVKFIDVMQSRR